MKECMVCNKEINSESGIIIKDLVLFSEGLCHKECATKINEQSSSQYMLYPKCDRQPAEEFSGHQDS